MSATGLPPRIKISNARSRSIRQGGASPVPLVETALYGVLEDVTFNVVTKRINPLTFQSEETKRTIPTMASVQPLKVRELAIKPEGERRWTWLKIYALPALSLQPGDVIESASDPQLDQPFRVMGVKPWAQKGYNYYEAVADYQVPDGYNESQATAPGNPNGPVD